MEKLIKKYLILFLSILIFTSCTKLVTNLAKKNVANNEYYEEIFELDELIRKNIDAKELFKSHSNIFNS